MNAYIITVGILFALSFAFMIYYSKVFWLKLSTVTLLFILVNMIYFGFDSLKGWPSNDKITKGQLVYVEIVEPTETYDGAIYLYVRLEPEEETWYSKYINFKYWDEYAPRSYFMPYTEKTSKTMREAKEAMEKGFIVEVEGESADTQGGEGEAAKENKPGGERPDGGDVDNYNVPHLKLVDPRERSGKVKQ